VAADDFLLMYNPYGPSYKVTYASYNMPTFA